MIERKYIVEVGAEGTYNRTVHLTYREGYRAYTKAIKEAPPSSEVTLIKCDLLRITTTDPRGEDDNAATNASSRGSGKKAK